MQLGSWNRRVLACAAMLLAMVASELITWYVSDIRDGSATLFPAAAYVGFFLGRRAVWAASGLMVAYAGLAVWTRHGMHGYPGSVCWHAMFVGLVGPLIAVVAGTLRERLDRLSEQQIESEREHARQLSVALERAEIAETGLRAINSELERRVEERTNEIERTRLEVIHRLSRAAEYRDDDTGLHIVRIGRYCKALAKRIGFDEDSAESLMYAAQMHDIGKIGIPDHILLKPGPLTREERAIIQAHTEIGAEILAGSPHPMLQLAHTICKTHHERWDGAGYPAGLKGEEIPLGGRICAICDVFDALISERPYKRAWSIDDAAAEIRSLAGTHFDPRLTEAFLDILPEIEAIYQSFRDEQVPTAFRRAA